MWRVGLNDDDGPAEVTWTSAGHTATATITERVPPEATPAHGKLAPTAHGGELASVEKAMRLYGPPDNQHG